MKSKPNIDNFIAGTPADKKPAELLPHAPADKPRLVQKIFKISEDLAINLEQRCIDERRKLGRRVTQNELAEIALRNYLS